MSKIPKVKAFVSNKSHAVPIEMRPIWRMSLIAIVICIVSGDKKYLDIKKVNILVWMLIRRLRWEEYENFLLDRDEKIPLVSVDTSTYKAVEFSLAKGLIRLDSGRLYITEGGERLYEILIENEIMSAEIEFLKKNGKKLTDKKVKKITGAL